MVAQLSEHCRYLFQAPELVARGSREALDLADSLLRYDTYLFNLLICVTL
jgi:hypothetical protein